VGHWHEAGLEHDGRAVSYIDAGYAIAFVVLGAYSAVLWRRRQRLERAASSAGGRPSP
jgi:hypothetical protein